MLVEGQVHGGMAQGVAQALYEEVVYDENGQFLSGSLMDYAVPKAAMMPWMELEYGYPDDRKPPRCKGCW